MLVNKNTPGSNRRIGSQDFVWLSNRYIASYMAKLAELQICPVSPFLVSATTKQN